MESRGQMADGRRGVREQTECPVRAATASADDQVPFADRAAHSKDTSCIPVFECTEFISLF